MVVFFEQKGTYVKSVENSKYGESFCKFIIATSCCRTLLIIEKISFIILLQSYFSYLNHSLTALGSDLHAIFHTGAWLQLRKSRMLFAAKHF